MKETKAQTEGILGNVNLENLGENEVTALTDEDMRVVPDNIFWGSFETFLVCEAFKNIDLFIVDKIIL